MSNYWINTKLVDGSTQVLKTEMGMDWSCSTMLTRRSIKPTAWKGHMGKRRVGRLERRWTDYITEIAGSQWLTSDKDPKKNPFHCLTKIETNGKNWRRTPQKKIYSKVT